jgi:hypothetical protein
MREEAEHTEEALSVVIIMSPPRPVPVILHVLAEEVHANVVPIRACVMWATSTPP